MSDSQSLIFWPWQKVPSFGKWKSVSFKYGAPVYGIQFIWVIKLQWDVGSQLLLRCFLHCCLCPRPWSPADPNVPCCTNTRLWWCVSKFASDILLLYSEISATVALWIEQLTFQENEKKKQNKKNLLMVMFIQLQNSSSGHTRVLSCTGLMQMNDEITFNKHKKHQDKTLTQDKEQNITEGINTQDDEKQVRH